MTKNQTNQAKPSFVEFFDPHNSYHIQAYKHLEVTGAWPDGFKPVNIYMNPGWQTSIAFKMTRAWIDYITDKAELIKLMQKMLRK